MEILIFGLLPIVVGIIIGIMQHVSITETNQKAVNEMKEKIKGCETLDLFDDVVKTMGTPNEIAYDENKNKLCSWIVRNQYHILYKATLKFENETGKNLGKFYETEQL